MTPDFMLLIITLLAGAYVAWNIGANDVANAMGTSVGSGALTLRKALLVASVLEFSGAFFFGSHVSQTLQSGIVKSEMFIDNPIVIVYGMVAALLGTGAWLQIASYFGWPVSTTHGIVGGVVGFGAVVGGWDAVYWDNVFYIVTSWILSPFLGGVLSYGIFNLLLRHVLYTVHPVAQAKRLTPIIAFIVIVTLAQISIYEGLKHGPLHFSLIEVVAMSLSLGALAAFISYLLIRRIQEGPIPQEHPYGGEVANELDKAKKHLSQALIACRGQAQFQVSSLLSEIDNLSMTLKHTASTKVISVEYIKVERIFAYMQILSACLMAFAHGANDVANAIGPLSAAISILETGKVVLGHHVSPWILGLGGVGIIVGLATWGWRVIETIGRKITELTPTRGFAAEFGAAGTILLASRLGLPISTTHTLVGSVVGVGLARGIEALDLRMTRDIVLSWLVTVPVCGIITIGFYYLLTFIFG